MNLAPIIERNNKSIYFNTDGSNDEVESRLFT